MEGDEPDQVRGQSTFAFDCGSALGRMQANGGALLRVSGVSLFSHDTFKTRLYSKFVACLGRSSEEEFTENDWLRHFSIAQLTGTLEVSEETPGGARDSRWRGGGGGVSRNTL